LWLPSALFDSTLRTGNSSVNLGAYTILEIYVEKEIYLFSLEVNRKGTTNTFREKQLDISDGLLVSF